MEIKHKSRVMDCDPLKPKYESNIIHVKAQHEQNSSVQGTLPMGIATKTSKKLVKKKHK
jgi:hypothetical protein